MKQCYKCKLKKPLNKFAFKNKAKGIRGPYCKKCQNSYNRKYYNKQEVVDKKGKRKRYIKSVVNRYKLLKGCFKCRYKKCAAALEFHHFKEKDSAISNMIGCGYSLNKIKVEIKKCGVICANCHRELHHG